MGAYILYVYIYIKSMLIPICPTHLCAVIAAGTYVLAHTDTWAHLYVQDADFKIALYNTKIMCMSKSLTMLTSNAFSYDTRSYARIEFTTVFS